MWRACSTCKKPIALNTRYFVCSVSTCQRTNTNFAFCAVDCWDAHVPTFRHKDAWAEERISPATVAAAEPRPAATTVVTGPTAQRTAPAARSALPEREVLIVASKLKAYIQAKSGMSTSTSVMDALSDKVRRLADQAIEHARRDGRKTVMDRDIP